ncbi:MAG: hypothetical protein RLZZ78_904 [Armatimonadota bacterium]|jgi:hypothetical protein
MMFGVTGTALATNRVSVIPVKPSKSIYKVITADWFWALCIVIGAVLIPAPSPNASTVLGLPKLCIFRNITGIACPGCGMTRSMIAAGHLHLEDSLTFHPMGPAVLVIMVGCAFIGVLRHLRHQSPGTVGSPITNMTVILCSVLLILTWILRLLGVISTPA